MNGVRMTDEELTNAYRTYGDMVYRLAFVKLQDRAKADDIQQDVFMALVRYSDRIRSDEHLKAWLIRVTINACHKHFRSFWERKTVYFDDQLDKPDRGDGGEETDGAGEPAAEAPPDDLNAELTAEAVAALPDTARVVIHLFYYENLPVRRIAQVLRLSEAAVKTRLSRARDALRKQLEGRVRL